jgi:hypothetical protein
MTGVTNRVGVGVGTRHAEATQFSAKRFALMDEFCMDMDVYRLPL